MSATPACPPFLLLVEDVLRTPGPLDVRVGQVVRLLADALDASRVAIYADSEASDAAVRVRASWSRPGQDPLQAWTAMPPLVTTPRDDLLVISTPRGRACPPDCSDSLPDCPLRGACSSIIEPLGLGELGFGRLAVHGATGREWLDEEVLLVRNVGWRLGLEIARARQERALKLLEAERASVAMTVLHQLSTPVTVLNCVIEELSGRLDDPLDRQLLDTGGEECSRLLRLCDDIRSLVAVEDVPTTVRCDVVHAVAAFVRHQRQVHPDDVVSINVVGEIPGAHCSERALQRMLHELFDNARRYARDVARMDVTIASEGERMTIRVRDRGTGVDDDRAAWLGTAFTRLDPAMHDLPGGSGLGLAIARRLARDVSGTLRIGERTDRPGTQVSIELLAIDAD